MNIAQEEIQPIPDRILSWRTCQGFIDLYIEKAEHTETLKQAYELAELDFQTAYKSRRYLSYTVFLTSKWQLANKLLKKRKAHNQTK